MTIEADKFGAGGRHRSRAVGLQRPAVLQGKTFTEHLVRDSLTNDEAYLSSLGCRPEAPSTR